MVPALGPDPFKQFNTAIQISWPFSDNRFLFWSTLALIFHQFGRDCSSAGEEHMPHNQKVMGSNPARSWAFLLLLSLLLSFTNGVS